MAAQATGRLGERDGQRAVVFERTFRAPIEDVWAAITEPERLARWIGTWTGDPAEGAVSFTNTAEGDDAPAAERYEIRACDPPRRLVIHAVNDYGAWTLHADLSHENGVTTFTFAQVVADAGMIEDVGPGWDWYLDRLVAAESGAPLPGLEDFHRNYDPGLRDHYRAVRAQLPNEGMPT